MPAKFQRKNPVVIIGVVLMVLLFIATLYPLVFTIMVSLKSTADFTVNPIGFPTDIRWLNFVDAWELQCFVFEYCCHYGVHHYFYHFVGFSCWFCLGKAKPQGWKTDL